MNAKSTAQSSQTETGHITQIIGAVVDVAFEAQVPAIHEALRVDDVDLVLEVQQQLGDGVVRTGSQSQPWPHQGSSR